MREVKLRNKVISENSLCLIANVEDLSGALESRDYANALEVRCDCIARKNLVNIENIVSEIRKKVNLPLIATIRRASDGGEWYKFMGSEQDRLSIFRSLYNYIDGIDIEEDSEIRDIILEEAKDKKLFRILSYHDFVETKKEEIKEKIKDMYLLDNSEVVKVASYANSFEDTITLFEILRDSRIKYAYKNPLSVIALGGEGIYTRLIFPLVGSCITYGFSEGGSKKYAPGQISVQLLRELIGKYSSSLPLKQNNLEEILTEVQNNVEKITVVD